MSNLDDFDQPPEHFDGDENEERQQRRGIGKSVAAAWQASPVFKIFLLLVGGGAIASAALGVFSTDKPKDEKSIVSQGSKVTATPGGEAPPAFQQAVNEASQQRVNNAMQQGGSALPTPMGNTTQMTQLDPSAQVNNDPLAEFRAAGNDNKNQPPQPPAQTSGQPVTTSQIQVTAPVEPPMDQGLAQAMQQQMGQLVSSWQPTNSKIITVMNTAATKDNTNNTGGNGYTGTQQNAGFDRGKALVSAGTINYAQMAIEANSDVPGPVMAQILSGPFSGGRAVGQFQSTDDYLIIRFTLINFKGRDYPVDALALNPDTTLGGLATETDQRYFSRVILPAAGEFVSGFASAFAQPDQNVFVQDGVIISQRTGASLRRGLGQGMQGAGQQVSSLLQQEANKIHPLVRVAAGTPIGFFFVSSVFENDPDLARQQQQQGGQNSLLGGLGGLGNNPGGYNLNGVNGYGNQIYPANGQNYAPAGYALPQSGTNYGTQPYNNPYGALNNGSTSTNYGGYNGNGVTVVPANGSGGATIINTR